MVLKNCFKRISYNESDRVYAFLLLMVYFVEQPFLNNISGYILLFAIGLLLIKGYLYLEKYQIILMLCGVLSLLLTPNLKLYHINNVVIIICISLVSMVLTNGEYSSRKIGAISIIDLIYYIFWIDVVGELIKYVLMYPDVLKGSIITEPVFWNHYHHVDYSIIISCVFFIGYKLRHRKLSIILAFLSILIIPARTLKLFFAVFVFVKICEYFSQRFDWKGIRITPQRLFLTYLFVEICIIIFALIWILVLSNYFSVGEGHSGYYNQSEWERFNSILYSVHIIINQRLWVSGLDTSLTYSEILEKSRYAISIGPHNSMLNMCLHYSVFFTVIYIWVIFRNITKCKDFNDNLAFLVAYLTCSLILHDMFISIRGFLFIITVFIPVRKLERKRIFFDDNR